MVEPVGEDGVARFEQRLDDADIGHVAGGKKQRARVADEFGQCLFELVVVAAVAVDEMGRAAADAEGIGGALEGGDDVGMVGEAEVVVAAEADDLAAIDAHERLLRRVGDAAEAV